MFRSSRSYSHRLYTRCRAFLRKCCSYSSEHRYQHAQGSSSQYLQFTHITAPLFPSHGLALVLQGGYSTAQQLRSQSFLLTSISIDAQSATASHLLDDLPVALPMQWQWVEVTRAPLAVAPHWHQVIEFCEVNRAALLSDLPSTCTGAGSWA